MPGLFAPPTAEWKRVSLRLRDAHRYAFVLPGAVAGLAVTVVAHILLERWWLTVLLAVVVAGGSVWGWVWAARHQAAWGYAENAEDLYVTSGIMWRRLVSVPYGRMQYVDVQAGPLARRFGIARITLHTASPDTAATIPGLPADEAQRLRDRLTELGEAHGAGL
ncbi:PH domain-containing protein [Solicola gregarius]|uniref:PH domain-containing protein n=1 Tax=Solicola gregarius TaxID=2908642 RepID=A0AA46TIG9_9ACTN|nr:PH domain-containing protein [Solicola gregarius]UYM05763.1 PH domain-containing protein [Solicola gregarius]